MKWLYALTSSELIISLQNTCVDLDLVHNTFIDVPLVHNNCIYLDFVHNIFMNLVHTTFCSLICIRH